MFCVIANCDIIKKRKEIFYHLEVGFDPKTKLVSILNKVPTKKMFDQLDQLVLL